MRQPILPEQPFFKIVFPLVMGILSFSLFMPSIVISTILFGSFSILFVIAYAIRLNYRTRLISGLLSFFMFYSLGLLICNINGTKSDKDVSNVYTGQLNDIPVKKGKNWQANIHLTAKLEDGLWMEDDLKVLAYFTNDSSIQKLKAGNEILLKSELREVSAPKNPFDFNFKRYLALKNIKYNVYLKPNDWILLSEKEKGLKQMALNIRKKIIDIYTKNGLCGDQLAVFSALTLGYKNKLDAKLRKAYSGAGATHVLAVSGMHVGIIYIVLDWIFKLLTFFRKKVRLTNLVIIVLLWGYAMVTGLSPSVLRATIMFSFILFGYTLNKRPNVYNSLAASALLLLLINPNYLYDVGFQLSYVAVAGIVFLYPKIYELIYVPTWFLNSIWQLVALSIAAQLSTFPISIFYFKQFAAYFWLSNIVVSVSATILLFSAVLLVLVSPFNTVSALIGKGLNYFIELVNKFIFKVNSLPHALIRDVDFNAVQVVFIYLMLGFFIAWLINKKYNLLRSALLAAVVLISFNIRGYLLRMNRSQICVYNIYNASAIQCIEDEKAFWITKNNIDDEFVQKANQFWEVSTDQTNFDEPEQRYMGRNNFIAFHDYKFLIIDETMRPMRLVTADSINLDFVLVRGNPSIKYTDLPGKLNFNTLIIDGSVPTWKRQQWLKEENVCVHETSTDGMFLLSDNQ